MALDMKKMRAMQTDINKKSGEGDGVLLFAGKLTEETNVRLLPPSEEMAGSYFVEQEGWWINGKFYLSNTTSILGGTVDVIEEEVNDAKESEDPDVKALVNRKNSFGLPMVKREVRYLIPLVMLDVKYDDDDYITEIREEDAKILVAKPTLMRKINALVTSKPYQNGTANGLLDREKGWNLILSKTGKGTDTEYDAMGWTESTQIDQKWYSEKVWKTVDPISLTKSFSNSDEHLRSVIRNYLYGDPIIEDAKKEKSDEPKGAAPSRLKKSVSTDAPTPAPKSRATAAAAPKTRLGKKPASRNLLDDAASELENM